MPLPSSVHQDSTDEKKFHITQEGDKWVLRSKSTGKVLGTHPTKEAAEAQERAVQANKHSVKVTVDDMRAICVPCADKMEADGVKHFFLHTDKPDMGLQFEATTAVFNGLKQFAVDGTHNIKGVEIFSSGTWNQDTYTNKDLDAIVAAFKATKDALKPYLKLGHSEDQALLAADSLPAAGWIANVYRKGSKLLADFADMPQKIYDLVKARAYKRVSSELFVNVDVGGKKYPFALKAVALLGGETPAVQNLDDVHALYALDQTVLAYANKAEVRAYSFDSAQSAKEDYTMEVHVHDGSPAAPGAAAPGVVKEALPGAVPAPGGAPVPAHAEPDGDECYKQLKAAHVELDGLKKQMASQAPKMKDLEGQAASYKLENQTLRQHLSESQEELGKAKGDLQKIFTEKKAKEVKDTVAKFVQEKKILPSQAPALEAVLLAAGDVGVKKFKVGGKDFNSAEDLVLEFVSMGSAGLQTEPKTESGKSSAVPDANDGAAVDAAVKEFVAKSGGKLSYREAYIQVAAELAKGSANKA